MDNDSNKIRVIVAGGGPAGLTAAYFLAKSGLAKPIVIELNDAVGGLSRTIPWRGRLFDIGPHRFFSKSPEINNLWKDLLPLSKNGLDGLLNKKRITSILNKGRFFEYPINFNFRTLRLFRLIELIKFIFSYIYYQLFPVKTENNLEDFYINHFGRQLYKDFFKDYSKKVWGVDCHDIAKDWGAQRIKSLSMAGVINDYLRRIISPSSKASETSLIDNFLYPSLGAGQMYEKMSEKIVSYGGEINLSTRVEKISFVNGIPLATIKDLKSQQLEHISGDYIFSSLPIKDLAQLIDGFGSKAKEVAINLPYRDFILVVLSYKNKGRYKDNWIYVHDKNLRIGRLDLFHNFSQRLLSLENESLFGLEYFCQENDDIWSELDDKLILSARNEMMAMQIADDEDFLEGTVFRQRQAYPAYFGSYKNFSLVREHLDSIERLYCIGRNGQHRYNNMDHAMMTGWEAAKAVLSNGNKEAVWSVNTELDYHEENDK